MFGYVLCLAIGLVGGFCIRHFWPQEQTALQSEADKIKDKL
jgi:hypothetical protein